MTNPIATAVVRFAARGSVSWSYLAPVIALLGVFLFILPAFNPMRGESFVKTVGVFCLLYAMPHAVNRISEWDRDGRLDHVRLAGHRPAPLLWSLILGSAAPYLVVALLLLLPTVSRSSAVEMIAVALVLGAVATLSFLALALPGGPAVDARLIGLGMTTVTIALALFIGSTSEDHGELLLQLARVIGVSTLTLIWLLTAAFVITSAIVWGQVRALMARPQSARATQQWLITRTPYGGGASVEFWRALRLLLRPAAFIALFGAGAILVLPPVLSDANRSIFRLATAQASSSEGLVLGGLMLLPLLAGVVIISTTNRADRENGRFELLRSTSSRNVPVVSLLIAGQWLPFVLATVLVYATVQLARGGVELAAMAGRSPERALAIGLLAITLAPLPFLEGSYRRWPFAYLIPVGVMFLTLVGRTGHDLFRQAVVAWIPWYAAFRAWRAPDRPALWGRTGLFAVVAVSIAVLSPLVTQPYYRNGAEEAATLGAILILMLSLICSPNLVSWQPGIAAAAMTATLLPFGSLTVADGLILSVVPFCAWWSGMRLHQLTNGGARSVAARACVIAVFLPIAAFGVNQLLYSIDPVPQAARSRDLATVRLVAMWAHGILAVLVLGGALLIEIAHRWTVRPR